VVQDDIQLVGEVWSSGIFEDALLGAFNMSVLTVLSAPFATFAEDLPLTFANTPAGKSKV
jgi:hypothetical protein